MHLIVSVQSVLEDLASITQVKLWITYPATLLLCQIELTKERIGTGSKKLKHVLSYNDCN
jgi:hypothetical protein